MLKRLAILLSLPLLTSCSTVKPTTIIKTEVRYDLDPAALLKTCPPKQRKKLETVGMMVDRITYLENALDTCAAQIKGLQKVNNERLIKNAANAN